MFRLFKNLKRTELALAAVSMLFVVVQVWMDQIGRAHV